MKLTTAGESHGKGLIAVIEGLPANLKLDFEEINYYLSLRQGGYGRGARQKIERDTVEADTSLRRLTKVRPGHADLAGVLKYGHDDARNVLERASARETAARVAAGTVAKQYLKEIGVEISGFVKSVCGVTDEKDYPFEALDNAKKSRLFMLDKDKEEKAVALLDELKENGDTAGGVLEIRVKGLKSGFGSCMTYDQKLDARLAFAAMSVQAVKGVEIGLGFKAAGMRGSKVHDEIYYNGGYYRKTNNAGGIEGGMSNGEEIVLRAAMKPIPTLMCGLNTVDIITHESVKAASERSDVCAVCAAEVILESAVAFALAQTVAERLGGDDMREVKERYALLR